MSFEIRWTEDAIQDYKEILSYLESNWGKSSAYKF
jgi:plasmid stabilization system protein ParE